MYKDNDFLDKGIVIQVGPERAKLLNAQIATDTSFLQSLNIMDYSLLLGIHDVTLPTLKRDESFSYAASTAKVDASINRSKERDAENDFELHPPGREEKELSEMCGAEPVYEKRQTTHAVPPHYCSFASPASVKFLSDPLLPVLPKELEKKPEEKKLPSPSELDSDGGVPGQDEDGQFNNKIYYMGIIDILIEYGAAKKAESRLKSLKYKLSTISACPPDMYAKRFKEFLALRIQ